MLPELKSKVAVVYEIEKDTLLGWPSCVGELKVWVESVYGSAE
jgi:hypothetical protein